MFVQRDTEGKIVGAFACNQSFPVQEVEDDNTELLAFLNRIVVTEGEI